MDASIEKNHSTDEILGLPEGKRAEIIDGRWYDMAPPTLTHQRLLGFLYTRFREFIAEKGGGCEVIPAPFAVYLNSDSHNYVEPDISVICDPQRLDDDGLKGAPDLVVEIVSPSSKKMDYMIKLFKYRTAGVREYWVVNPMTRVTNIYYFDDDDEKAGGDQVSFDEPALSHIYEGFEVVIADGSMS